MGTGERRSSRPPGDPRVDAAAALERFDYGAAEELTRGVDGKPATAETAALLLLRARALGRMGRLFEALRVLEAALASDPGPEAAGPALRLEQAGCLCENARYDTALAAIRRGMRGAAPDEARRFEVLRAFALSGRGDQEAAREILLGVAERARAAEDRQVEADALARLALVEYRAADTVRAEERARQAVAACGTEPSLTLARAHRYLAVLCGVQRRYGEAMEHHRRVVQICRWMRYRPGLGREYLSLGLHYLDMGETELAELHMRKGLTIAEACEDETLMSIACSRLGVLALSQGRVEEARELFEKDYGLAVRTEAPHTQAFALRNVGRALRLLGRPHEATQKLRQSAAIFETVGDRVNLAITLLEWGVAEAAERREAAAALERVGRARALLEEVRRVHVLPQADLAEALVRARTGDPAQGEACFDRAAEAWRAGGSLSRLAEACAEFGATLADVGARDRAVRCLRRGLEAAARGSQTELTRLLVSRIDDLDEEALVGHRLRSLDGPAAAADEIAAPATTDEIVGGCPAVRRLRELIAKVAPTEVPVLIVGESGAGKELVARAIHGNSPRRNRPLVVVNCGAIPEHLVESELFGHTRGAYTSADRASPGKFAVADGGTVFLDEVGDLPLAAQVALLRFLQSGELQTVGDASVQPRRTDVRVVAASNRDLATLVAEGRFRGDLLFRLAVFPIHVPPLRDRRDDIPALVRHLLAADPVFRQRGIRAVSVAAMQALKRHPWPGNVRQLRSALVSAAILADSDVVLLRDLPDDILGQGGPAGAGAAFPKLAEVELEHIERALALCGGNRSRAARLLGVHRNTLRARLAELTGTGRGR